MTEGNEIGGLLGGAILGAALALPGLATDARAENAPEHAVVGMRWLDYRDRQPGLNRIHVSAPSTYFLLPVAGDWSIAGSFVQDAVSGASPRWHSSTSSASRMSDLRHAGDLKITRYTPRAAYSVSYAFSNEHDYDSQAFSGTAAFSSDDNNRTWTVGVGVANDRIDPVNLIVVGEHKRTVDLMLGVTQVLSPTDIGQATFTTARGRGYFNDPYKFPDNRPRERDQAALLLRWNHHFAESGNTLRATYRLYGDSFGIRAHTATVETVVPLGGGWSLTPLGRFHTQNAAKFYYDPVYDKTLGEPYPPGYLADPNGYRSPDARLSAFGALTIGLKVSKELSDGWTVDFRGEYYQQRSGLRLVGKGSPGIAPLSAVLLQTGISKKF